jgi:DNA polymerase III epsilon subunit
MDWKLHAPFTFFDLETTGLSPKKNRIIELAAIRLERDASRREFSTLINPGISIPPEAMAIHGISDEMVKDAPSFADAGKVFLEFSFGSVLVAHNASFDLAFLQESLFRDNMCLCEEKTIDSIKIFKRIFPGLPSYSLSFLRSYFGINPRSGRAHRALADVEVLVQIFLLAAGKLPEE